MGQTKKVVIDTNILVSAHHWSGTLEQKPNDNDDNSTSCNF